MKKTLIIISILIAFSSGFALDRLIIYRSAGSSKKLNAIIKSRDIELTKLTAEEDRMGEFESNYTHLKALIENERTVNQELQINLTTTKKSLETLNQAYEKLMEQSKLMLGTGKGMPPNIEEVILHAAELEHQLPDSLFKELQQYPAFKDFQDMLLQLRKRPAVL